MTVVLGRASLISCVLLPRGFRRCADMWKQLVPAWLTSVLVDGAGTIRIHTFRKAINAHLDSTLFSRSYTFEPGLCDKRDSWLGPSHRVRGVQSVSALNATFTGLA